MDAAQRSGWLARGVLALLSVAVGAYALFHAATGFVFLPADVAANTILRPWGLYTHIAASGFALIAGPFQFDAALRVKRPSLHRGLGYVYVAACLIGGVSGLLIAWGSTAGPVAGGGFFALALAWLYTLGRAYAFIRVGNVAQHERWMIRSFALTLAAVTLRIYLPVGVMTVGFPAAYPAIAWLAWVPNIVIAELWLAYRSRRVRP
jgi:uncharacterized membrane protein